MALKFTLGVRSIRKLQQNIRELERNAVDQKTATALGRVIVKGIRDLTERGDSPIKGPGVSGKLPAYRRGYVEQIRRGGRRFPGPRQPAGFRRRRFRGKSVRPVNLRLSGEFMRSLRFKVVNSGSGKGALIGFRTRESERKERGHREGANNQRKRPIIPEARRGETFAQRITQKVLAILNKRINAITKRPI